MSVDELPLLYDTASALDDSTYETMEPYLQKKITYEYQHVSRARVLVLVARGHHRAHQPWRLR